MKFSIRDLLFVTVIVALALGWWVDHWRQAEELERYRGLSNAFGKQMDRLYLARELDRQRYVASRMLSRKESPNSSTRAPIPPKP